MKRLFLFTAAAVLACAMMATSCRKDERSSVTLTDPVGGALTALADQTAGGTFTFTASGDWVIDVKQTAVTRDTDPSIPSKVDWLTLKSSGADKYDGAAGTHTLTVELKANYTGQPRAAKLHIISGGATTTLSITQTEKGQNGQTLAPTAIVAAQNGALTAGTAGTATFAVTTAGLADSTAGQVQWIGVEAANATNDVSPAPAGVSASVSAVASGAATVTVTTTDAAAQGEYEFRVVFGQTISNNATLTIGATPTVPVITIDAQPTAPAGLTAGSIPASAALGVEAGVPDGITPAYQWYSYDPDTGEVFEAIEGATSASYTLPTDLAAGDHWYVCQISAQGARSVQTDPVKVTVAAATPPRPPQPPTPPTRPATPTVSITTQPQDLTLTHGAVPADTRLTVTASVTGGATLSYQWYNADTDTAIGSETGASIAVPTGVAVGVYKLYCVVSATGAASKTSRTATVTVESGAVEPVVINGVAWAPTNVDAPGTFAAAPQAPGMFYQYNRKVGYSATDPMVISDGSSEMDTSMPPSSNGWETANDPCPEGWRVPQGIELESLLDPARVTSVWSSQNGADGVRFTDIATGKNIFLPFTGYREAMITPELNGELHTDETNYWAMGSLGSGIINALKIRPSESGEWSGTRNTSGCSVRCVKITPPPTDNITYPGGEDEIW